MERSRRPWYRSRPVDLALRLLYYSGALHLLGLVRKHLGRKRLIVLMYHRLSAHNAPAAIAGVSVEDAVPARRFEQHMRMLRWFGDAVSLERGYDAITGACGGPRTRIAVTFDDGYSDNLSVGLPIWSAHGIPVTIFPAVAAVDRGAWMWWDEACRAIGELAGTGDAAARQAVAELAGRGGDPASLPGDPAELVALLSEHLVALPMHERRAALDKLRAARAAADTNRAQGRSGCDTTPAAADRLYLTWQELRMLADHGVTVGGHTIGHPRLPLESDEVAEREIRACRAAIEQQLGRPVRSFAYPGGYHGEREIGLVARSGYNLAVTVEKGANYRGADRYRLRRIGVSWDRPHHLAFKLVFCGLLFGA